MKTNKTLIHSTETKQAFRGKADCRREVSNLKLYIALTKGKHIYAVTYGSNASVRFLNKYLVRLFLPAIHKIPTRRVQTA